MTELEKRMKHIEEMIPTQDMNRIVKSLMNNHYAMCITMVDQEEELNKYKRAFEIFKRFVDKGNYVDLEFGVFDGTVDISDEEIELLEELLKG